MHNVFLRPILSRVNCFSSQVATFFVLLVSNLSSIRDSFSFVQELATLNIDSNNVVMTSFDVNLVVYYNTIEIIDLIGDSIFHGLTQCKFRKLLDSVVMESP